MWMYLINALRHMEDKMDNIEFHEGDFVQRKDGTTGYVESVCHCDECLNRGFFEPTIKYLNGETEYLTNYDVNNIPKYYIQIGTHIFSKSVPEPEKSKNRNHCPKYSLIGEITYKDIDPDIISNALLDMKNNNYVPVLKDISYSGAKLYWILKKEN